MRVIDVTYRTQVPEGMTDEEIMAWLRYTLTERYALSTDNPMSGCGPEPYEETIRFEAARLPDEGATG